MYRDVLYIGFGVYGIIFALGTLALFTVRKEDSYSKENFNREITERIMQNVDFASGKLSIGNETINVRVINKQEPIGKGEKLFPFMREAEKISNTLEKNKVADTEGLYTEMVETEMLEEQIKDTELISN
jgi:hypothetical protein